MIYTFVAYAPQGHAMDLGWSYNRYMELLPSKEDWACFLDHDAMFTTREWYGQLNDIICANPDAGCFTAMTNRIGNATQVHGYDARLLEGKKNRLKAHFEILDSRHTNHDVQHHREVGRQLAECSRTDVQELAPETPMSGVLILTQKAVWQRVPFVSGFLGVDRQYHLDCLRAGYKVYLMRGVYIYHWYRGDGDLSHVEPYFCKKT